MRLDLAVMVLALVASAGTAAQTLYKYRGENGEWIYADRPPADGRGAEAVVAAMAVATVVATVAVMGAATEAVNRI